MLDSQAVMRCFFVVLFLATALGCNGKSKCEQARARAAESWSTLARGAGADSGQPARLSQAYKHMVELLDKDRKLEGEWAARIKAGIALAKLAQRLAASKCAGDVQCLASLGDIEAASARADSAILACKNVKPCNQ